MRITRNQLRRVIREELTRNLFEQEEDLMAPSVTGHEPEVIRGDPKDLPQVSGEPFEALEADSAYVLAVKQAVRGWAFLLRDPWLPEGVDEVRLSVGPGGQAISFAFGSSGNPDQEVTRIAEGGMLLWINNLLKDSGAKLPEGNHKFPVSAIV